MHKDAQGIFSQREDGTSTFAHTLPKVAIKRVVPMCYNSPCVQIRPQFYLQLNIGILHHTLTACLVTATAETGGFRTPGETNYVGTSLIKHTDNKMTHLLHLTIQEQ